MVESDVSLLAAWRAGDARAGNELARSYYGLVWRFFEVKARHVAEDLVQQTFLAAVEGRDRILGPGGFKAYLLGVARLQLLTHIRKSSRRGAAMNRFAHDERSGPLTPTGLVALKDEQRVLLLALNALPTDLQIAVQLFYLEGMAGADVAVVLDVAPSTIRSRLGRARDAIRTRISELAPGPRVSKSLNDEFDAWARSLVGPSVPPPDNFVVPSPSV